MIIFMGYFWAIEYILLFILEQGFKRGQNFAYLEGI